MRSNDRPAGGSVGKVELVNRIAFQTKLSRKNVNAVINTFWHIVGEAVAKDEGAVQVPGWIKIERRGGYDRYVRDPSTGIRTRVKDGINIEITAGSSLEKRANSRSKPILIDSEEKAGE